MHCRIIVRRDLTKEFMAKDPPILRSITYSCGILSSQVGSLMFFGAPFRYVNVFNNQGWVVQSCVKKISRFSAKFEYEGLKSKFSLIHFV